MRELEEEDIGLPGYISFQRMHPHLFKELLENVSPLISNKDMQFHEAGHSD